MAEGNGRTGTEASERAQARPRDERGRFVSAGESGLPNPNPDGTAEIGSQFLTSLEDSQVPDTLQGIFDQIVSLNMHFTDFVSMWKDNMDDEARARSETMLESQVPDTPEPTETKDDEPMKIPEGDSGVSWLGLGALAAILALFFVDMDKLAKWMDKELLPAIKKFWKEGLVPFYNDVLVPLGELLADYTTGPLATAVGAYFKGEAKKYSEFTKMTNLAKDAWDKEEYGKSMLLGVASVTNFVNNSMDNLLTGTLNLLGVDMGGESVNEKLAKAGIKFGIEVAKFSRGQGELAKKWFDWNMSVAKDLKKFGDDSRKGFDDFFTNNITGPITDTIENFKDWLKWDDTISAGGGDDELDAGGQRGDKLKDIVSTSVEGAIGYVDGIFKWISPEDPFKLSTFIDETLTSIKSFFTNEKGTGILDFKEDRDFTLENIFTKLIKKITKFFTDMIDMIDPTQMLNNALDAMPDAVADKVRTVIGIEDPKAEEKEIERQRTTLTQEISDLTEERKGAEDAWYWGGESKEEKQAKIDTQIAEKQAELWKLGRPSTPVSNDNMIPTTDGTVVSNDNMIPTTDSTANAMEAKLGSSKEQNQPMFIGGGGGGAAPDMRDQRVFASNNIRTSVSKEPLSARTHPHPIVRKFSAAGYM